MASSTVKPRTAHDLRSQHDRSFIIPKRIQAGIDEIAKIGPEHYEYQLEFLKRTGLSVSDLSQYRDQFKEFTAEVPMPFQKGSTKTKVIFCGTKKQAAKYREMQ